MSADWSGSSPHKPGQLLLEFSSEKNSSGGSIEPGKSMENAYAESFIGRLRDECPNENSFLTLKNARDIIENWQIDYDDYRPHSSLGGLTPREFVDILGRL